MKILVAIANYGTKNTLYVQRLIDEYNAMPYEVDIIILSNIAKDFGNNIKVKVGLPEKNPWTLPFGHKQLFADYQNEYDLFIYSEDDTLITQKNIQAFFEAQHDLPDGKIAGFLRYEEDQQGNRFCSTIHSHYHWRPGSLRKYGQNYYAYFTNMHSACFLLTREQLKHCISSGGFLVPPHEGKYDLLCSAATDPYTQCGLEKVICISRIDDFLLHHLPNQYLGKMGLSFDELHFQINRMIELGVTMDPNGLIPESTGLDTWQWEKRYYSQIDKGLTELMPDKVSNILSIGCGQGKTEQMLVESGRCVEVIPLDAYIAPLAEKRGLTCLNPLWNSLFEMSQKKKYDLIYLADILDYVKDPIQILQACNLHIHANGGLLLSFNNFNSIRNMGYKRPNYDSISFNFCTNKIVKGWLKKTDFEVSRIYSPVSDRLDFLNRVSLGLLRNQLSSTIYFFAKPLHNHHPKIL